MAQKTLQELRTTAKSLGLTGYSKLRRDELERRIQSAQGKAPTAGAAADQRSKAPSASRARGATATATAAKPASARAASSKTHAATAGQAAQKAPTHDAGLYLIAQRPGKVAAIWRLDARDFGQSSGLVLRLFAKMPQELKLLGQADVTNENGSTYFDVPQDLPISQLLLRLGHVRAGKFEVRLESAIRELPSSFASANTDRQWWVAESYYREMYRRGGGQAEGERLTWGGSTPATSR